MRAKIDHDDSTLSTDAKMVVNAIDRLTEAVGELEMTISIKMATIDKTNKTLDLISDSIWDINKRQMY